MSDVSTAPRKPFTVPFLPSELSDVRARTPLAALVGRDVRLTRKGNLWSGLCPFHGERKPSFCVYPDHYHCFSCGVHGDAIRYIMDRRGIEFIDAVRELAEDAGLMAPAQGDQPRKPLRAAAPPSEDLSPQNFKAATTIFLAGLPALDTPVDGYLKNRKIDLRHLGHVPGPLRYHPRLLHGGIRDYLPAMVAAVNGPGGHLVAVHRTWLEYAGGAWIKARLGRYDNKMVLGTHPGGSIHLWKGASDKKLKDAPEGDPVVIAEGIETALSIVMRAPERRVLCGLNQGNMGGVWLPPQIGDVILALDNDAAVDNDKSEEKRAKAELATARMLNRWYERGYKNVRIIRSPVGKDFNDALREGL